MNLQTIKASCSNCNLRELCMPMGLDAEQMQRIDDIVATRRKVKRGGLLFRNGEAFTSLYAIRTGFFKTCVATEDGRDQVTGFQMAGEIIGLDGIVNDHHTCDAVALEDAEVCVMPFDKLEDLSREVTALQNQRLHARGFSKSELVLRMTREEIGSYLGLKLETVSRTFSKFAEENIIEVRQRHLRILDTDALKRIVNSQQCQ
jgi:CRP/FNR family transcriptional regulator